MESSRPRARSFVVDETPPPPPPGQGSGSPSSSDDDFQDGLELYDPTLVFDDDDDNVLNNNFLDDDDDDDNENNETNGTDGDSNSENCNDNEENDDDYYSRGRSRSRSVHCNDDLNDDGKPKGLSEEELSVLIEESAKNNEKKDNSRSVVRTGALKQREVSALEKGLREATHQTKEEERLEEEAEKEAAMREKEERSVSISNTAAGRGSFLQTLTSPPGVDPPMRRVKILLLGDSSVGKSSLIHRLTDNTFKQSLVATVGVDYKVRKLQVNGENVQVQLWDTAGSEKFHKITQSYYRGVHGIMLVFDVSNRKSFKHVSYWLSNISKYANENVQVQLVGNKVDLRLETKKDPDAGGLNKFIKRSSKSSESFLVGNEGVEKDPFVQTYEGQKVASKYHINYTETSALSNTNIEESLAQCVKQVINQIDNPNLISSLRDKLKKGDSKSRLSSGDSRSRINSGEKKGSDRKDDKVENVPSKSKSKDRESTTKDKDCVIS